MLENRLPHCRRVGRHTFTAGNGAKADPYYYTVFNTVESAYVYVCVGLFSCSVSILCLFVNIYDFPSETLSILDRFLQKRKRLIRNKQRCLYNVTSIDVYGLD